MSRTSRQNDTVDADCGQTLLIVFEPKTPSIGSPTILDYPAPL